MEVTYIIRSLKFSLKLYYSPYPFIHIFFLLCHILDPGTKSPSGDQLTTLLSGLRIFLHFQNLEKHYG